MKLFPAFATAGSGAALLIAFDTLWVVVLERDQPLGYFAWTAALIFAAASVIGFVGSFADDPPPWIAAGLAAGGAWLGWGAIPALLTFLALCLALGAGRRKDGVPALHGVATAVGLGVAAIVSPRLLARLPFLSREAEGLSNVILTVVLIVTVLAVVEIGVRLARKTTPHLALAAIVAGLFSLAALPLVSYEAAEAWDAPAPTRASGALSQPHIVLLVLDTVRADHLSLYGYERETTPRLESFFARRGSASVFPSIYANSNWTVPSHASLFTGLPPSEHGAHFGSGSTVLFSIGDHVTLAEVMQSAGYRTSGFHANPWLGIVDGFDRGFETYRSPRVATRLPHFGEAMRRWATPGVYSNVIHAAPRAGVILDAVKTELLSCGDESCFVFANLIDAHSFYAAEACRGRFADWSLREEIGLLSIHEPPERTERLMARYDEEICDLDLHLGNLLRELEADGVLDETWVFITSDHGEAFGDHGNTEHGTSAYNDQIWIPLLVIPPAGIALEPHSAPGSLVDVTATIAAIGGGEKLGVGRDLRREPTPDALATIEFYGDESKRADQNPRAADPARAVALGGYKLVDQSDRLELFDLRADPAERRDLAAELPDMVERLRPMLPDLRFAEDGGDSGGEISAEMLQQLRELGYGR